MEEFLDLEDNEILVKSFEDFSIKDIDYYNFWSWQSVQLDGDFDLNELHAIVQAMESMKRRHNQKE